MNIQEVPVQLVNQILPRVEHHIASALSYTDDYTIDEARVFLVQGTWSLIVMFDEPGDFKGAAAVQYYNRPRDRVAFIIALGGRLISDQENAVKLFDIFRANGATSVEAAARDSILKFWQKYGLEKKYIIIGATL